MRDRADISLLCRKIDGISPFDSIALVACSLTFYIAATFSSSTSLEMLCTLVGPSVPEMTSGPSRIYAAVLACSSALTTEAAFASPPLVW